MVSSNPSRRTDTDIVWFQNPLPLLAAMRSDFVVQSNAPWPDEEAANGPLRINSGFYRVRSTPTTVAAMESIVAHAATSTLTEQPSFYIILCGGREGANKKGTDKCIYTPAPAADGAEVEEQLPLEVEFLDRLLYPNGAVGKFWDIKDIQTSKPELVILHNNWIRGLRSKFKRVVDHRLWYYARDKEACDYSNGTQYVFDWSVEDIED